MDFLDQRVQMALWDPMAPQVPKEKEVKKELWENPDPEDPMGCLGKMESLVLMASLVHEARRVM